MCVHKYMYVYKNTHKEFELFIKVGFPFKANYYQNKEKKKYQLPLPC